MNYVLKAWYVAAWEKDLSEARPLAISLLGEPIVIYRGEQGRLVALEDRCVHRLAPLSQGRCEGEHLRCMYHGLLFAPDGRVVEIPGQDMIPEQARVRRYAVAAHADWIWVWMGEAEEADLSLLPEAIGPSNTDYLIGCGQLDYAAEAALVHDNLLDFSHLSYVHANSFEATEEWANTRMKVVPLDRGVRFERWLIGQKGPSFVGSDDTIVDGYLRYDFLIPGVLLMWAGMFAEGTAARIDFGHPDYGEVLFGVTTSAQAVVPSGERAARYFFNTGTLNRPGNAAILDKMMTATRMAFEEDRHVIEGQQRILDRTPHPRMMPIAHDKGVTLFNRLVERLCREERAEHAIAAE